MISALGAGAVRGNLIAFGADQIQGPRITSRYIDKFIVAIHMASILTTMGNIVVPIGPTRALFFQLYVFAASMLFIAVLLFLIGWRYYTHEEPFDSVIVNCIPVIRNAFVTWRQSKKSPSTDEERGEHLSTFLSYAKTLNHGKFQDRFVNDVESFRNALVTMILIIPCWFIMYQV